MEVKTTIIVSEMLCDDGNCLRTMEKPLAFRQFDEALAFVKKSISADFSERNGYMVSEVEESDDGETHRVTAYFDGGLVEYRIDKIDVIG